MGQKHMSFNTKAGLAPLGGCDAWASGGPSAPGDAKNDNSIAFSRCKIPPEGRAPVPGPPEAPSSTVSQEVGLTLESFGPWRCNVQ